MSQVELRHTVGATLNVENGDRKRARARVAGQGSGAGVRSAISHYCHRHHCICQGRSLRQVLGERTVHGLGSSEGKVRSATAAEPQEGLLCLW